MKDFDLFVKRLITLYLNAKDKIKTISLLSKQWREFVYSGYAWQCLFSPSYYPNWNSSGIKQNLFKMFSHFKGVKNLMIYQDRFCTSHLQAHISQIENLFIQGYSFQIQRPKDKKRKFQKLLALLKNREIFKKIKGQNWGITRLHVFAYFANKDQIQDQYFQSFEEIGQLLKSSSILYDREFLLKNNALQIAAEFNPSSDVLKKEKISVENQQSVLFSAVLNQNSIDSLKFICNEFHADINAMNESHKTLAHLAVTNTNLEVLKYIIDNGGDINAQDTQGWTPTNWAIIQNNSDALKYILERGVSINHGDQYNATALHMAVRTQNLEILQLLVDKGGDINAKDVYGQSLAHLAANEQNIEILKYIIKKGGDINAREENNQTPAHIAASKNKNTTVLKCIIDNGGDINAKNVNDQTPAHNAAASNHKIEILKCIIENGGDINARNQSDLTPCDLALIYNNFKVIKYFVNEKIDVSLSDNNQERMDQVREYLKNNKDQT